jgi:phosphatidyl-myo-inositol dimannoside synthase
MADIDQTNGDAPVAARTPPSIFCITRAYPPVRGGMEQFSYDLTTQLATRTRTAIVANRYGKAMLPLFALWATARAGAQLKAFDVLHLGDPVLAGMGSLLRRLRGTPTAMNVHGLDILHPGPLYQWYLRRFLGSADLYICISAFVERQIRERFGITRSIIIPPGIRDTLYRPTTTRAELPALLGMDPGSRPLLLSVGRLVRRKGHAWFAGHVLPRLPAEVLYIIVGSGPETEAIRSAAVRAGVSDRLLLTGSVSEDALRVLYNTADIFVMPNILVENDAEGFGLVALEAASCARPVVASAVEGIVDAVYDGRNGVLVEAENADSFAEKISLLLSDAHRRETLSATAREFTLSRFSWNVIVQKYLDAFEHLRRL